jgi:NADPH-dependent glutamate synthase beta subunit-like oxidoreductase
MTLGDLRNEHFQAVFVAVGAWAEHTLDIDGIDAKGVYSGIDFLERFQHPEQVKIGKNVVIIGGGNTAIDCSRSALRLGAETVTIVYRRSRNEMPANPAEIVAAEEEGVRFRFLHAPNRVITDNGNVNGLELIEMALGEPDPSGRRRPVPVEGSESILSCDMIIQAVGQKPDISALKNEEFLKNLNYTRWNTVDAAEETLQTDIPYIFTGGDCFTGPGLVVEAIAAGRYAARSIHYYVTEGKIPPIEDRQKEFIPDSLHKKIRGVDPKPRVYEPIVTLEDRLGTFKEVEGTIDEEDAIYEASRCLNCGIYCYDHEIELEEEKAAKMAEKS